MLPRKRAARPQDVRCQEWMAFMTTPSPRTSGTGLLAGRGIAGCRGTGGCGGDGRRRRRGVALVADSEVLLGLLAAGGFFGVHLADGPLVVVGVEDLVELGLQGLGGLLAAGVLAVD